LDVIPEIAQSMTVRDLKAQLSQREALLQGLLTKYKEKWPDVIQARQDVESLRDSLDEECQKIYESIMRRAEIATATAERLRQVLEEKQRLLLEHNRLRIEYEALARAADQKKMI